MQDYQGDPASMAKLYGSIPAGRGIGLGKLPWGVLQQARKQQPVVGISKEAFQQRQQQMATMPPIYHQFASTLGGSGQDGIHQLLSRLFGQGGGF